jgi:hypothetical protein
MTKTELSMFVASLTLAALIGMAYFWRHPTSDGAMVVSALCLGCAIGGVVFAPLVLQ